MLLYGTDLQCCWAFWCNTWWPAVYNLYVERCKCFLHAISREIQAHIRELWRIVWYLHAFQFAVCLSWHLLPHHGSQEEICSRLWWQEELNKSFKTQWNCFVVVVVVFPLFFFFYKKIYKVHKYCHLSCKVLLKASFTLWLDGRIENETKP